MHVNFVCSAQQLHQLHHKHPGENPETMAPGRAESIQAENNKQFSEASQRSGRSPQTGFKDYPPDVENLHSPQKHRWRPRRSKQPTREGMDRTSSKAPAAGRVKNPQEAVDLARRQGILRPDVFVGGPLQ